MADADIRSNLRRRDTWVRGLFILLFAAIYSVAEIVLAALVVFQFGHLLLSARRNANALRFGASLSRYLYEVLRYVTFNLDDRPWPFSPWSGAAGAGEDVTAPAGPAAAGKKKARRRKKPAGSSG